MTLKAPTDPHRTHRENVRAACEGSTLQALYEWRSKLEDGAEKGRTGGYRELSRVAVEAVTEAIAERRA